MIPGRHCTLRSRLLAAAAVALALGAGGCSKDTETSIYIEVFNEVGAATPQQASVDIYAPPAADVMGVLLGSKVVDVAASQTSLLGSLVILTGTRTNGVHVRAQGLVNGVAVSQGEIDVVITAKKQVTTVVTLAALEVHPDGGMDLGEPDAPVDLVADVPKDEGIDVDVDIPDAAVDLPPGDAVNGAPCTANAECASTFCVDGVCCGSACDHPCHTCAPSGVCTLAMVGTDPRTQCDDLGATTCMTDGVCDGAGACRLYALPDCVGQGLAAARRARARNAPEGYSRK